MNWFTRNVEKGAPVSQKGLEETIHEQFPAYKEKTVHNAVYQLRRTLKESPIGSILQQYSEIDKESFTRESYDDLSREAIAYSIFKYADARKIKTLRVHDLYSPDATGGVNKEFCISKSAFTDALRSLNSERDRVFVAELNMGLDSITINRDDLKPLDALKSLLKV